jgi:DNA repair protein RadC
LNTIVIAVGTKNEGLIDIQEVLKIAIVNNAASYILAHNHPTGDLRPSKADKKLFKRLKKCSRHTGIPICDSVIVHKNEVYGMKNKCKYQGIKP